MKKFVLAYLVIVLAGCSFSQNTDLNRNRDKWQQAGVTHYRFSVFIGCFCPFGQQMPLSVEVRDGQVASLTYPDGTLVPATDPNFEFFSRYATIDRLFSELETELNGEADEVIVTYDSTYGYPTQISLDYIKEMVDDELSIGVSDFQILD